MSVSKNEAIEYIMFLFTVPSNIKDFNKIPNQYRPFIDSLFVEKLLKASDLYTQIRNLYNERCMLLFIRKIKRLIFRGEIVDFNTEKYFNNKDKVFTRFCELVHNLVYSLSYDKYYVEMSPR